MIKSNRDPHDYNGQPDDYGVQNGDYDEQVDDYDEQVDDYDEQTDDDADYDEQQQADEYDGSGRQPGEPVLQEITNPAGDQVATVTRNHYGSLVLNAHRAMFLDIDRPKAKRGQQTARHRNRRTRSDAWERNAVANAWKWARAHYGFAWRIYRTHSGLRLLATHDLFDAAEAMQSGVAEALNVDPYYRKLVTIQGNFRARLTPKPWRCGSTRPEERWPFADKPAERRFNNWQRRYDKLAAKWATCALIATVGCAPIHPEVLQVIDIHDRLTRVRTALPLA